MAVVAKIRGDATHLSRTLRTSSQEFSQFAAGARTELGTINLSNIAFGAVGVTAATSTITDAIQQLGEYEVGLRRIGKFFEDFTDQQLERLGTGLRKAAYDAGVSVADAIAAGYQAKSLGADSIEAILENVRITTQALVASGGDGRQVASLLQKTANTFPGYTTTRIGDIAAKTEQLGDTTLPLLATSAGQVTPFASELGITPEEVFALFAFGSGTIGGTRQTATTYRALLGEFVAPQTRLYQATQNHFGMAPRDLFRSGVGVGDALTDLYDARGPDAFAQLLGSNKEALAGALLITGNPTGYQNTLSQVTDSQGTLQAQAEYVGQAIGKEWDRAIQSFKNAQLEWSEGFRDTAGSALQQLADALTDPRALGVFEELGSAMAQFSNIASPLTDALGRAVGSLGVLGSKDIPGTGLSGLDIMSIGGLYLGTRALGRKASEWQSRRYLRALGVNGEMEGPEYITGYLPEYPEPDNLPRPRADYIMSWAPHYAGQTPPEPPAPTPPPRSQRKAALKNLVATPTDEITDADIDAFIDAYDDVGGLGAVTGGAGTMLGGTMLGMVAADRDATPDKPWGDVIPGHPPHLRRKETAHRDIEYRWKGQIGASVSPDYEVAVRPGASDVVKALLTYGKSDPRPAEREEIAVMSALARGMLDDPNIAAEMDDHEKLEMMRVMAGGAIGANQTWTMKTQGTHGGTIRDWEELEEFSELLEGYWRLRAEGQDTEAILTAADLRAKGKAYLGRPGFAEMAKEYGEFIKSGDWHAADRRKREFIADIARGDGYPRDWDAKEAGWVEATWTSRDGPLARRSGYLTTAEAIEELTLHKKNPLPDAQNTADAYLALLERGQGRAAHELMTEAQRQAWLYDEKLKRLDPFSDDEVKKIIGEGGKDMPALTQPQDPRTARVTAATSALADESDHDYLNRLAHSRISDAEWENTLKGPAGKAIGLGLDWHDENALHIRIHDTLLHGGADDEGRLYWQLVDEAEHALDWDELPGVPNDPDHPDYEDARIQAIDDYVDELSKTHKDLQVRYVSEAETTQSWADGRNLAGLVRDTITGKGKWYHSSGRPGLGRPVSKDPYDIAGLVPDKATFLSASAAEIARRSPFFYTATPDATHPSELQVDVVHNWKTRYDRDPIAGERLHIGVDDPSGHEAHQAIWQLTSYRDADKLRLRPTFPPDGVIDGDEQFAWEGAWTSHLANPRIEGWPDQIWDNAPEIAPDGVWSRENLLGILERRLVPRGGGRLPGLDRMMKTGGPTMMNLTGAELSKIVQFYLAFNADPDLDLRKFPLATRLNKSALSLAEHAASDIGTAEFLELLKTHPEAKQMGLGWDWTDREQYKARFPADYTDEVGRDWETWHKRIRRMNQSEFAETIRSLLTGRSGFWHGGTDKLLDEFNPSHPTFLTRQIDIAERYADIGDHPALWRAKTRPLSPDEIRVGLSSDFATLPYPLSPQDGEAAFVSPGRHGRDFWQTALFDGATQDLQIRQEKTGFVTPYDQWNPLEMGMKRARIDNAIMWDEYQASSAYDALHRHEKEIVERARTRRDLGIATSIKTEWGGTLADESPLQTRQRVERYLRSRGDLTEHQRVLKRGGIFGVGGGAGWVEDEDDFIFIEGGRLGDEERMLRLAYREQRAAHINEGVDFQEARERAAEIRDLPDRRPRTLAELTPEELEELYEDDDIDSRAWDIVGDMAHEAASEAYPYDTDDDEWDDDAFSDLLSEYIDEYYGAAREQAIEEYLESDDPAVISGVRPAERSRHLGGEELTGYDGSFSQQLIAQTMIRKAQWAEYRQPFTDNFAFEARLREGRLPRVPVPPTTPFMGQEYDIKWGELDAARRGALAEETDAEYLARLFLSDADPSVFSSERTRLPKVTEAELDLAVETLNKKRQDEALVRNQVEAFWNRTPEPKGVSRPPTPGSAMSKMFGDDDITKDFPAIHRPESAADRLTRLARDPNVSAAEFDRVLRTPGHAEVLGLGFDWSDWDAFAQLRSSRNAPDVPDELLEFALRNAPPTAGRSIMGSFHGFLPGPDETPDELMARVGADHDFFRRMGVLGQHRTSQNISRFTGAMNWAGNTRRLWENLVGTGFDAQLSGHIRNLLAGRGQWFHGSRWGRTPEEMSDPRKYPLHRGSTWLSPEIGVGEWFQSGLEGGDRHLGTLLMAGIDPQHASDVYVDLTDDLQSLRSVRGGPVGQERFTIAPDEIRRGIFPGAPEPALPIIELIDHDRERGGYRWEYARTPYARGITAETPRRSLEKRVQPPLPFYDHPMLPFVGADQETRDREVQVVYSGIRGMGFMSPAEPGDLMPEGYDPRGRMAGRFLAGIGGDRVDVLGQSYSAQPLPFDAETERILHQARELIAKGLIKEASEMVSDLADTYGKPREHWEAQHLTPWELRRIKEGALTDRERGQMAIGYQVPLPASEPGQRARWIREQLSTPANERVLDLIHTSAERFEGYTITNTGEYVKEGYPVAQINIPPIKLSGDPDEREQQIRHATEIIQKSLAHRLSDESWKYGGWTGADDTGETYQVELSKVFPTRLEAVDVAHRSGEKATWDIKAGENVPVVYLGDTEKERYANMRRWKMSDFLRRPDLFRDYLATTRTLMSEPYGEDAEGNPLYLEFAWGSAQNLDWEKDNELMAQMIRAGLVKPRSMADIPEGMMTGMNPNLIQENRDRLSSFVRRGGFRDWIDQGRAARMSWQREFDEIVGYNKAGEPIPWSDTRSYGDMAWRAGRHLFAQGMRNLSAYSLGTSLTGSFMGAHQDNEYIQDLGGVAQGGLTGWMVGSTLGSILPGGTAIGGLVGGAIGAMTEFEGVIRSASKATSSLADALGADGVAKQIRDTISPTTIQHDLGGPTYENIPTWEGIGGEAVKALRDIASTLPVGEWVVDSPAEVEEAARERNLAVIAQLARRADGTLDYEQIFSDQDLPWAGMSLRTIYHPPKENRSGLASWHPRELAASIIESFIDPDQHERDVKGWTSQEVLLSDLQVGVSYSGDIFPDNATSLTGNERIFWERLARAGSHPDTFFSRIPEGHKSLTFAPIDGLGFPEGVTLHNRFAADSALVTTFNQAIDDPTLRDRFFTGGVFHYTDDDVEALVDYKIKSGDILEASRAAEIAETTAILETPPADQQGLQIWWDTFIQVVQAGFAGMMEEQRNTTDAVDDTRLGADGVTGISRMDYTSIPRLGADTTQFAPIG